MIPRDRVAAVWVALVLATAASWLLGGEHLIHRQEAAAIVVIAIAFVKVRLVGMHFMELHAAPTALRAVFQGWCLVAFGVLTGLYLGY
jgi:hypothetical protein